MSNAHRQDSKMLTRDHGDKMMKEEEDERECV